MKNLLALFIIMLLLNACKTSKRKFECDCGEFIMKVETKTKNESTNQDFRNLMDYMDKMEGNGCECSELDGDESSLLNQR